jgi:2,5-diamino-6-(ribosylamino)-4(3H)-pyrimidinone 5'-phosphate reductase
MSEIKRPNLRPHVVLNAAMSLDGKIATVTGAAEFSSKADWKRVHKLRSQVDAIMVGINTILKDDPKLYVKHYETNKLWRIIIDSNARTPLDAKIFQMNPGMYPIIIAVTNRAPGSKIQKLEELGAKILRAGDRERVDLPLVMQELLKFNIEKVLLEGGGTLNFSMLQGRLVDEVIVAIAPVIIGGRDAISLVEGAGVRLVENSFHLEFIQYEVLGNNIVLHFLVKTP